MRPSARILCGDVLDQLRSLPDESVHCCVTSPPYWGLRDYGHDGQIGLESSPEEFVVKLVEVFREVRRVLVPEGTLWLNLGDSYAGGGRGGNPPDSPHQKQATSAGSLTVQHRRDVVSSGMKPKDLCGIPWSVAFALRADGWWLRQDIIWHKPNPMPESVRDRCTKAHEYLFLLTKSERYYYDAEAIKEPAQYPNDKRRPLGSEGAWKIDGRKRGENGGGVAYEHDTSKRNRRSVWTVTPKPFKGAHFAVMPPDLVEPCVKAGCPKGGTVLDPFAGSGTTLAVAIEQGRSAIGIELNPDYCTLIEDRVAKAQSKFALFA